jgi:hemolysin III
LKLDHGAIYFFIAGSYTPFALGAMNGSLDWFMLGLVWAMALAGATLKVINRLETPWLSTGLYLAMGWLVLVAAVPIVERVSLPVFNLLVAGGLAYTVGVVFFVLDAKLRYAHTVWHGFVAAGTGCHYFAVLGYLT